MYIPLQKNGIIYLEREVFGACPEGGRHTMTEHSVGEIQRGGKEVLPRGYVHQGSK